MCEQAAIEYWYKPLLTVMTACDSISGYTGQFSHAVVPLCVRVGAFSLSVGASFEEAKQASAAAALADTFAASLMLHPTVASGSAQFVTNMFEIVGHIAAEVIA
jgi:hypothetical protein